MIPQRSYIHVVITILKDEGLYKNTMPSEVFVSINKKISDNYYKKLTIRECVNDIVREFFNKVA